MIRQADIIAYARTRPEFSRREMLCSFRENNLAFSPATVASSLVALTESGILRKVKRGVFAIADTRCQPFVPFFDGEMQNLESLKSASNLNGNLNCSKELEHYAS